MFGHGRLRVALLALVDAVCIAAAWSASVLIYWLLAGKYDPDLYLGFWPVVLAFILCNAMLGLYHGSWLYPGASPDPVDELRKLFLSALITHLGVITVLVMLFQTTRGYSRVAISLAGFLTAFFSQPLRNSLRYALMRAGIGQIPVIMAGSGEVARRMVSVLKNNSYSGFRIVGYFNGVKEKLDDLKDVDFPCLGSFKDIVPVSKRLGITILLACQDERYFKCQMKEFSSWFTYIEFLPTVSVFPVFGSKSVTFGGLGGLEMVSQTRKRLLLFEKRVLDLMLSVVAFVAALPFFIVIPILVKLTSKGPVFYCQTRLGRGGRRFRVWKFRSMYVDADARLARMLGDNPDTQSEWLCYFKLKNDPRVTPLGRILRRTSLDELPQLINVFRGEMALIGPRPIVEAEIGYYGSAYETISSVKPGITGLWQVSGRSDTDYPRRVALDSYYVLNWSPWIDVWILIHTVSAVMFMRGAR